MLAAELASLWDDWYNAEVYDHYVREYPIYSWLNRRLAELAELKTARRLLDIACGSGATARTCLETLPPTAALVGIDASEVMVEVARTRVRDPRARFEVAPARALPQVVSGPFDRAVCNAAFWNFPSPETVIAHLGRLLGPGALFVFNVPAERVVDEASEVHPFQLALRRSIEAETGRALTLAPLVLDPARLEKWLDRAGFELEGRERLTCTVKQGELLELMRIPAMITPLAPDLSPRALQSVVSTAAGRVDPQEPVTVPWIYFRASRR